MVSLEQVVYGPWHYADKFISYSGALEPVGLSASSYMLAGGQLVNQGRRGISPGRGFKTGWGLGLGCVLSSGGVSWPD